MEMPSNLADWQREVLSRLLAKVQTLRTEVSKYQRPSKGLLKTLKNAELDAGLAQGRFAEPEE